MRSNVLPRSALAVLVLGIGLALHGQGSIYFNPAEVSRPGWPKTAPNPQTVKTVPAAQQEFLMEKLQEIKRLLDDC